MKIRNKSLTAQLIKDTFSYYPQTRCEYIALLALSIALVPWSLPIILLDRVSRDGAMPDLPGIFGLCLALIWILATHDAIGGTTTFWVGLLLSSLIVPLVFGIAGACVFIPLYQIHRILEWWKRKRIDKLSPGASPGDIFLIDGEEMMVTKRNSGTIVTLKSGQTVFIRNMRWARRACRSLKKRACAKIEYVEDQ